MKAVDFTQSNLTLRAGGNTQTIGLKIALCTNKQIPGPDFFVSRWEMEEYEQNAYREKLTQMITILHAHELTPERIKFLVEELIKVMPKVWVSAMHTPPPVMVLASSPAEDQEPYPFQENFLIPNTTKADQLNKLNSHPDEN